MSAEANTQSDKMIVQEGKKQKIDAPLRDRVELFFHSKCIGRNRYPTQCSCKKDLLDAFNKDDLCDATVITLENYRGVEENSRADNIKKTLKAHHHSTGESLYSIFQRKNQKNIDIRLCINAIAEMYSLVLSSKEKEQLKDQLYSHKPLELRKTEIRLLCKMASYFANNKHRQQHSMIDWHKLLGTDFANKETFRKTMQRKKELRLLAESVVSVDSSIPQKEWAQPTNELLDSINGKVASIGEELHSFAGLLLQKTPNKCPKSRMKSVGTGIAMTTETSKAMSNVYLEDKEFENYKKKSNRYFPCR